MYLHLGQSVVVPHGDVLGIFDLDNASSSRETRSFLSRAEREGRVINLSADIPRSFAVCCHPGEDAYVYLSQLSSAALKGRMENGSFE